MNAMQAQRIPMVYEYNVGHTYSTVQLMLCETNVFQWSINGGQALTRGL